MKQELGLCNAKDWSPLLFVAMLLHGDIGYNETIVRQEDGSLKLIAEQNPMNAPG